MEVLKLMPVLLLVVNMVSGGSSDSSDDKEKIDSDLTFRAAIAVVAMVIGGLSFFSSIVSGSNSPTRTISSGENTENASTNASDGLLANESERKSRDSMINDSSPRVSSIPSPTRRSQPVAPRSSELVDNTTTTTNSRDSLLRHATLRGSQSSGVSPRKSLQRKGSLGLSPILQRTTTENVSGTDNLKLADLPYTKIYYPHLHSAVYKCGSLRNDEGTAYRRRWERREIESEGEFRFNFIVISFICELLPGPLAAVLSYMKFGMNFARSRLFLPWKPIRDTNFLMWISFLILVYFPVEDKITHTIEFIILQLMMIVRATLITFKYCTFGNADLFDQLYGLPSKWYKSQQRTAQHLLLNFVFNVMGTQLPVLIEEMYSGNIRQGLSPQLVHFNVDPDDARAIWKYVKWHGDFMKPDGPVEYGVPGKWGRHTDHKFAIFRLDLFEEVVGAEDEFIDRMVDDGMLPASILQAYIVISSYTCHCWLNVKRWIKFGFFLITFTACVPTFVRLYHNKPVIGDTYPEAAFNCFIFFCSLYTTTFMGSLCVAPMLEMRQRLSVAQKLSDIVNRGLEIEDIDDTVKIGKHSCFCSACRMRASANQTTDSEYRPSLLLNMSDPNNIASWDIVRRLVHGTNFGSGQYERGQFYMLLSLALECTVSLMLNTFNDSAYNHLGWNIEDHPEIVIPVFIRTILITLCTVVQVVSANSVNNEAETQAMALLRARTCWMQESEETVPQVSKAIQLIQTVQKAVEADAVGDPVCVMYLEGNYGTIGAIFTVLGSAFYVDAERMALYVMDYFFKRPLESIGVEP